VNLGYGPRVLLKNVNMSFTRGKFLGIVGPNGSGKTTLLRAILGWVKPFTGKITCTEGIRFGYVPQRNTVDSLYPLTALDIVLMGLYGSRPAWQRMTADDRKRAQQALTQVGLAEKSGFLFSELSGGQQQRTLLARALVGHPDVLILDEPTNGMDLVSEAFVMESVDEIHKKTGMAIIIVTHLLHVVAQHARELGLIQGDRVEFGPTDSLLTTRHLTELYGRPIVVSKAEGKTVVIAP
jgi:ABC-type Mn2+/Zn2+ transport system ATPase subunit